MKECSQVEESPAQIVPPLPVYESSQYMSRSVNLNQLIKLHRNRQKYEIVDRYFNNSYISVQNKLQPIEVYYQCEMFKSYIDDLALIYFKDIELNESIRLEFVLRRLNYTLDGEVYDFKKFLQENRFYQEVKELFSNDYLQELTNESNDKSVLDLRNSIMLCFIIETMDNYNFTSEQREDTLNAIDHLYQSIAQKLHAEDNYTPSNNSHSVGNDSDQSYLKSSSFESMQENSNSQSHSQQNEDQDYTNGPYNFSFEDMLYQEEIDLKIIEIDLEMKYFSNQLNDLDNEEVNKFNYKYIVEIGKEMIQKLNELKELNISNREIIKKIQRNIKIQLTTGVKCICFRDSSDIAQCFGETKRVDNVLQQKQLKFQKILDVQYMENQLLKMIKKLKMKLVADAIEKVYDIQKDESKASNELLFSISFEHGLGIKQATFYQSDFLKLNEMREQSTLTSYLTPMKSTYSYISHNIYTFLKLSQKDFPYCKETNNNEQIMKNIRLKMGKIKNFTKIQKKMFYQQQFKMCHNCKILCHQVFLKQCRKRAKQIIEEDSDCSDDSLYTQKNFRRKNMSSYFIECEKYYCLYCIRYQFYGKIFNDKGWCPACLGTCHCNNCLRDKIMKKYVELYLYIGGDKENIKTQMEMVNEMKVNDGVEDEYEDDSSLNRTQVQDKVYEAVIKKEIMKGYSADQIGQTLRHQEELIEMIIKREKVKLRHMSIQKCLFREKIGFISDYFDYENIDRQNEVRKLRIQIQNEKKKQEALQKLKKKRQRKMVEKDNVKRKVRQIKRDEQIYYDFYRYDDDDSQLQSSSFHLRQKRQRERKYEPQYNFD